MGEEHPRVWTRSTPLFGIGGFSLSLSSLSVCVALLTGHFQVPGPGPQPMLGLNRWPHPTQPRPQSRSLGTGTPYWLIRWAASERRPLCSVLQAEGVACKMEPETRTSRVKTHSAL